MEVSSRGEIECSCPQSELGRLLGVISYDGWCDFGELEQISYGLDKLEISTSVDVVLKTYSIPCERIRVTTESLKCYDNHKQLEGIQDYLKSRAINLSVASAEKLISFTARYIENRHKHFRGIFIQFDIDNVFFRQLRLLLPSLHVTVSGSLANSNSTDNHSIDLLAEVAQRDWVDQYHNLATVAMSDLGGEIECGIYSLKLKLKANIEIRWSGSVPEPLFLVVPITPGEMERLENLERLIPVEHLQLKIILKNGAVRTCLKTVLVGEHGALLKDMVMTTRTNQLKLENMEEQVFDFILKYLSGIEQPVSALTWKNITDILCSSIDYKIERLQLDLEDAVILKLKHDLTVDSAIRLFRQATREVRLTRLEAYLICVIGRFSDLDIQASPALQEMAYMQQHDLLSKVQEVRQ